MRLLLDTHALLWAISKPQKLSRRAHTAIENRRNDLYVSAVSAWEIATKHRLGRLDTTPELVREFPALIAELGAIELAVSVSQGLLAGAIEGDHADPFDRMLAAQAIDEHMQVVTSDAALADLGAPVFW